MLEYVLYFCYYQQTSVNVFFTLSLLELFTDMKGEIYVIITAVTVEYGNS
jgi:hypothetical protein